jgi:hypothetical protein
MIARRASLHWFLEKRKEENMADAYCCYFVAVFCFVC